MTRLAEWLETVTKIAMDKIQAEITAIVKYIAEELLEAGVTLPPEEGENDNA